MRLPQCFELDNVKNEGIVRDSSFFKVDNIKNEAELTASYQFVLRFFQSTAPATKKWCQVTRSAAPVTQNHLSKPEDLMLQNATHLRKSAPWPPNISGEHVSCTAPATKCIFPDPLQMSHACHRFLEMLTNPHVLLTFDKVHNPLRLPRETTSEPPKVARTCGVLYILTSKCASRIFAPQRRALVRHLNFQNCSNVGVLCTILHVWLRNVLRATTASKSVPRMVCLVHFDFEMCFVPQRRAILSSLIWPDGSAPATLASLLFDPPEPQTIGKQSGSRLVYLFAHLHLLSSDSFSSLTFLQLLFSSLTLPTSALSPAHIVGNLTSKLPSSLFIFMIIGSYAYIYICVCVRVCMYVCAFLVNYASIYDEHYEHGRNSCIALRALAQWAPKRGKRTGEFCHIPYLYEAIGCQCHKVLEVPDPAFRCIQYYFRAEQPWIVAGVEAIWLRHRGNGMNFSSLYVFFLHEAYALTKKCCDMLWSFVFVDAFVFQHRTVLKWYDSTSGGCFYGHIGSRVL